MIKVSSIASLFSVFYAAEVASSENTHFIEKMDNPSAYTADKLITSPESICGVDDLQHIEEYDNRYQTLGYDYNTIQLWGSSVGAIKVTANAAAGSYCSGTLIAPDEFLTASHCVDDSIVGRFVSFGYQLNGVSGQLRSSQLFFRIEDILEDGVDFGLDYALLRLAGNPGNITGNFPGTNGTTIGWKNVNKIVPNTALIIQHPLGEAKQIDAGEGIIDSNERIRYSDIDTQPGSSGSGVLNDNGEIVGVHTNGGCTPSNGSNSGVTMRSILEVSDFISLPLQTPEDEYLVGDWDGDGRDNIAVRRGNTILMDINYDASHDISQSYGFGDSEDQYLVGDWDGDGRDNIAVRRGNTILMDINYDGSHDISQSYGFGDSEDQYLVGDWDGDGRDNIAVRRGNTVLMDINYDDSHDLSQSYGLASSEDQYLVGDWDSDDRANIAVRRGNTILMDINYDGSHDLSQSYGLAGSEDQYLVGDWDGDGRDNIAVRRGNTILMDINYDGSHDLSQSYGRGTE